VRRGPAFVFSSPPTRATPAPDLSPTSSTPTSTTPPSSSQVPVARRVRR
jgi:hypothetical protein